MTRRPRGVVVGFVTFVALALPGAPAAFAAGGGPSRAVIVEGVSVAAATHAVEAVGGTVDMPLPLVHGVAAHVDANGMAALGADDSVVVVPDLVLHPKSKSFDAGAVDTQVAALDPGASFSPDAGRGVAVALVDTGVANTPDLRGSRLIRGPDLSGEGDGLDHYGHGTFMAGLIAGDGSASATARPRHTGIAPGATIVSVKVAGADGSSSVSRVIAGIGWVVTHRDTYDIRVLSLSFGVDPPTRYFLNPLDAAAEAAWASGITVVAAAGNEGTAGVTSPGDDPYVITVGTSDAAGTAATVDDTVPSWSGTQEFHRYAKPDVVAPGVSVLSLRAPGSTVDTEHPEGRVGDAYFRGTGTSMSTALVAGSAAILISHHPNATPDDIKGALIDGATTLPGGAYAVDINAADHARPRPDWWQHFPVAMDGLGIGLFRGMPWTASRWTDDNWNASRWTASRWTASRWTETEWASSRWTDLTWLSSRWTSSRWTSSRWTSSRWTSSRWTALAWPAQSWG